jgi:pilus assembly protein CpaC
MRTIRLFTFIFIIACAGTGPLLRAQAPLLKATSMNVGAAETETSAVRLMVGRSTVVDVAAPIARVSLTSADIADALVTSSNQLLINGKLPGTISMFVWDRSGGIRRYEVIVQRDLARLSEQIKQLFPGEAIDAQSNGRNIVLSGTVTSKDVTERAINLAAGYVENKDQITTLLQVRESEASNQVLLRVRFAEVSRSAMTELGTSLFTGANGYKNVVGRVTTEQQAAPAFDSSNASSDKLVFSDFLNLFLFDTKHQLGTVIKALQTKGLFQSLAEPNLVAESGKEASFLAGGEIPVPIAQGSGANLAISVQYKEFGVRLNFTPVVTGNRIHLKVRPEVSTLDFTNAVVLNGFRIPALSTRRTETEIELQNGQTFAIAGLMNNSVNSTIDKIPGIGDIPILGLLFKSKSAQKNLTELVVMITPEILPKSSPGVTTTLPRMPESYIAPLPLKKTFEPPPPAFTKVSDFEGANAAPAAPPVAVPPPAAPAPDPRAAAAAVSALTPITRPVVHADAAPPAAAQPAVPARPLTADDKKALERSHKDEERLKAEAAKEAMKQAEIDRREKKDADAREAKQAREDAKQAREQAKRDAAAAKVAAKQAAEQARRQAEIDKKQQKAVAEAEAKVKAAEKEYQAELAKAPKR